MGIKITPPQCDTEHDGVKIYEKGELTNSTAGTHSIIGEHSRVRNSNLGHHVRIDRNNLLLNVVIGDYSYTGPFDILFHVNIGKFTSISYGVTIGPPEHNYHRMSTHPMIYDSFYEIFDNNLVRNEKFDKPITIGNDVWIGCNSTILRGVNIGDGAIVGANSLVNKDVPPYAIVAGCPARIINYRFDESIIRKLLKIKWWSWDINKIKNHQWLFKEEHLTIEMLESIQD